MILQCENCNKTINKRPSDAKRSKHHYCSVSCSNIHKPRRKLKGVCKDCGVPIRKKNKRCKQCEDLRRGNSIDNRKISDTFNKEANKYSSIRNRARTLYSKYRDNGCQLCDYKKHVDICHIKDISDFSPDTKVKVVNDPSNIILLCKNCHWEFDHDDLDISPIPNITIIM